MKGGRHQCQERVGYWVDASDFSTYPARFNQYCLLIPNEITQQFKDLW